MNFGKLCSYWYRNFDDFVFLNVLVLVSSSYYDTIWFQKVMQHGLGFSYVFTSNGS